MLFCELLLPFARRVIVNTLTLLVIVTKPEHHFVDLLVPFSLILVTVNDICNRNIAKMENSNTARLVLVVDVFFSPFADAIPDLLGRANLKSDLIVAL